MSCASTIQNFMNQDIQGWNVESMAKWVSWQSYESSNYGSIPVALIIIQWGLESGWGGVDISEYYNPANQGNTCGYSQCGSEPNSLPGFCSINDGVHSYSNLLLKGYPHVMFAYGWDGVGTSAGFDASATALGQGYFSSYDGSPTSYCSNGASYALNSSSTRRLWATSEYGGSSAPGASIIDTFNANTCLQNLNYVQSSDPLSGF